MKKNVKPADKFIVQVNSKAKLKIKARGKKSTSLWFGLGFMGLIGWSIAIPTLLGTLLGMWLDKHHQNEHSWTLALLIAGLMIGCFTAWNWLSLEHKAINPEEDDKND